MGPYAKVARVSVTECKMPLLYSVAEMRATVCVPIGTHRLPRYILSSFDRAFSLCDLRESHAIRRRRVRNRRSCQQDFLPSSRTLLNTRQWSRTVLKLG